MCEEKHETKGKPEIIRHIDTCALLLFISLPVISMFILKRVDFMVITIGGIVIILAVILVHGYRSEIYADSEGVTLKKRYFWKVFYEKNYKYNDIGKYQCFIKRLTSKHTKLYVIIFNIIFHDDEQIEICRRLKCRFNLDRRNPVTFWDIVNQHPSAILFNYIMENKTRVFYEMHPELKEQEDDIINS